MPSQRWVTTASRRAVRVAPASGRCGSPARQPRGSRHSVARPARYRCRRNRRLPANGYAGPASASRSAPEGTACNRARSARCVRQSGWQASAGGGACAATAARVVIPRPPTRSTTSRPRGRSPSQSAVLSSRVLLVCRSSCLSLTESSVVPSALEQCASSVRTGAWAAGQCVVQGRHQLLYPVTAPAHGRHHRDTEGGAQTRVSRFGCRGAPRTSTMLSTTRVGRPSSRTWTARYRLRSRLAASSTTTTRSSAAWVR